MHTTCTCNVIFLHNNLFKKMAPTSSKAVGFGVTFWELAENTTICCVFGMLPRWEASPPVQFNRLQETKVALLKNKITMLLTIVISKSFDLARKLLIKYSIWGYHKFILIFRNGFLTLQRLLHSGSWESGSNKLFLETIPPKNILGYSQCFCSTA